MSNDGWAVAGQCVTDGAGVVNPGDTAVSVWYSLHSEPVALHLPTVIGGSSPETWAIASFSSQGYGSNNGGIAGDGSLYVNYLLVDLQGNSSNIGNSMPLLACDSGLFPVNALQQLTPPISVAIPLVIGIWLVWTLGYGIRSLIRTLREREDVDSTE